MAAPLIYRIDPEFGSTGDEVVITGKFFTSGGNAQSVSFRAAGADGALIAATSFTVDSDTKITAVVPKGARTGPITVVGAGGGGVNTASSARSFRRMPKGPPGRRRQLQGVDDFAPSDASFITAAYERGLRSPQRTWATDVVIYGADGDQVNFTNTAIQGALFFGIDGAGNYHIYRLVGGVWAILGVFITMGLLADVTTSTPGDSAIKGATGRAADAAHRHARADNYGSSGSIAASAPGDTAAAGVNVNIARIDHRHPRESTGIQEDSVAASATTTSTSYAEIGAGGPSVSAVIGASGKALVIVSSWIKNSANGNNTFAGISVDGGVPSDNDAAQHSSTNSTMSSRQKTVTGLSLGSHTFAVQCRVTAGTGTYEKLRITVLPL